VIGLCSCWREVGILQQRHSHEYKKKQGQLVKLGLNLSNSIPVLLLDVFSAMKRLRVVFGCAPFVELSLNTVAAKIDGVLHGIKPLEGDSPKFEHVPNWLEKLFFKLYSLICHPFLGLKY
jgi:hypothetical protein